MKKSFCTANRLMYQLLCMLQAFTYTRYSNMSIAINFKNHDIGFKIYLKRYKLASSGSITINFKSHDIDFKYIWEGTNLRADGLNTTPLHCGRSMHRLAHTDRLMPAIVSVTSCSTSVRETNLSNCLRNLLQLFSSSPCQIIILGMNLWNYSVY